MDIFAHALWSAAAAKGINARAGRSGSKRINPYKTAFWGIFPDIFAFAAFSMWFAYGFIFGGLTMDNLPRYAVGGISQPIAASALFIYKMTHLLYVSAHSLIVFFSVVAVLYLVKVIFLRKKRFFGWIFFAEMGGWLLHISIDIFTHPHSLNPTPIFWPLSNWRFESGLPGESPWFLVINYSLIVIIYGTMIYRSKRERYKYENT